MTEQKGSPYRYLLWGCGVVLLLPILVVSAIVLRTWLPLRSAASAGIVLEERFGEPGNFTPDTYGEIEPDRMEAFLNVRRALMEVCPRFEALEVWRMHFESEMSEEEPPTGEEIVDVATGFIGALDDLTPVVGVLFETRNKALLEAEMGVGEYIYLFTMAYGEALTANDVREMLFADGVAVPPASAAALEAILVNQLERLAPVGLPDQIAVLEAEITAMNLDRGRVPWQDGVPEALLVSLEPYRAALDSLFCPQTASMEIDLNADRAMAIALD